MRRALPGTLPLPCRWYLLAFPEQCGWRGLLEPQAKVTGWRLTLVIPGLLWGHPQTWLVPLACLSLGAERPLAPTALSSHGEDTGSGQRPKGRVFPFPAPSSRGVVSSVLSRVMLCWLVLLENSSERTMSGPGDVAPKEAPSLGALREEAAFLGNKEGLTAHSSPARTFHSIVLPGRELQGNESRASCLTLEIIMQSC